MVYKHNSICIRPLIPLFILAYLINSTTLGRAAEGSPHRLSYQGHIDLGLGHNSNVFLSDQNTQSDAFALLDASLETLFTPTRQSLIFGFINATFQDFFSLNDADELFANLVLYYRYRLSPLLALGISNTFAYTDLKLLDSEGEALPMDRFESVSDQIRLFGIYTHSKILRIEMGVFQRDFNVKEIGAEPSLDFKEIGGDLSSKHELSEAWSVKLRYKLKAIAYEDRQASNRTSSFDGSFNSANPVIRLRRHEFELKTAFIEEPVMEADIAGKYRINKDLFEDDLSYRQIQLQSRFVFLGLGFAIIEFSLDFSHRQYSDRKNALGSAQNLKEKFYIGEVILSKKLNQTYSIYIKFQGTTKKANDPTSEYNSLENTIGLKGAW